MTRSGHKVVFTEDESIIITDKSGNEIHLDTTGSNINITAPETMTLTAKNLNIIIAENINTTAGMNISENAGMNRSQTAGLNHSSFAGAMMIQNAAADYSLMAANIMETAQGERKSEAAQIKEIAGGNNLSYAKDIIENIGLQVIQDGKTSGVFYGINKGAPIISTNINLKKSLVHFRRPKNYDGKYGFDWLREEYIYPMLTVTTDNNGNPINARKALCKNTTALKQEYLNGVINNIRPYTINYYPAWLAIFPHTITSQFPHGSDMHENGINLDLQFDEIDQIISDGTEILFESQNQYLKISPQK